MGSITSTLMRLCKHRENSLISTPLISLLTFLTSHFQVRGGPKPALVVFATQSTSLIYQEAFLATYRSFISAQELIARLIIRYIFMMDAADMAGSDGEKKESKVTGLNRAF